MPLINEVGDLFEPEFEPPIKHVPVHNEFTSSSPRVKIPAAGKDSFLEAVEDALSLLKNGVGEFQGYFYESNITGLFEKGQSTWKGIYGSLAICAIPTDFSLCPLQTSAPFPQRPICCPWS